jgi:peptidoglycan/LPS O-acetylase OafA/YrhL
MNGAGDRVLSREAAERAHARYIPTLDGWRAMAILLVIVCHSADQLPLRGLIRVGSWRVVDLRTLGLLGVQIFFALSGFLITTRLLIEERRDGAVSLRQFYQRRALRILPAAFGFLAVIGLLAATGVLQVTFGRWLSAALLFANYSPASPSWYLGHFWSLAVEEHFYLLWPLLFVSGKRFGARLGSVIALTVLVTLWRAVAWRYGITNANPSMFWGRTDVIADNLLCGVAAGLVYAERRRWRGWAALLADRRLSTAIAALVLIVTLFEPHGWKEAMLCLSFKAFAIPLWIGGSVLRAESGGSTLLESAWLKWLGRLSYSLYLWQQLFLVWDDFRVPALAPVQRIPTAWACAVGCAYGSHRWLERPMIRWGRRLLRREVPRTGGVVAATGLPGS